MSIQYGRWSFGGTTALPDFLGKVDSVIAPYGTDDSNCYQKDGVSILYRAFHTTRESRRETQPHISESGAVIVWDGRLDNRAELIHQLGEKVSIDSADVSIVAAAYERWGTECLGKLVGDWALSIWNPRGRSLILAKDPIAARHLHYLIEKDHVTWSTLLDPLVLFEKRTVALDKEYIAGWLSFFPAAHLTPYVGISSVPPASFVRIESGRQTVTKYWDFDSGIEIRYDRDAEYEEHFRTVLSEAVRRRLRSDMPVLAELSGGMDSSSIVCMADLIIARGAAETPRLDTLSYYNDFEPNWNERPYFAKVEEKRGRTGCHIDVGTQLPFEFRVADDHFASTPSAASGCVMDVARQFAMCIRSQGNRVVLSGIGGDEVMGGVPTGTPELMDLLAKARFRMLTHQLKVWALDKRKPWFHLFIEAARGFFPPRLVGVPKHMRPAPWLNRSFVERHHAAVTGYPSRIRVLGSLPSFQENMYALDVLRRQLACSSLSSNPLHEKRYPYLDRSLLEFIFAVPREQIVRAGQRRSLMRRALVGIVPDELLNRKRKAFIARSPMAAISTGWPSLNELSNDLVAASLGIVDGRAFRDVLDRAHHGQEVHIVAMLKTLEIESWIRRLKAKNSSHNLGGRQPKGTETSPLTG